MPSGDPALANRDGLNQGLVLTDAQALPTFVDRRARELPEITDSVMLDAGALSTINTDDGRLLRALIRPCSRPA